MGDSRRMHILPTANFRDEADHTQNAIKAHNRRSISIDERAAQDRAKKTLAFYISVGEIYRRFLAKNGFEEETSKIYQEYLKTGLKTNYELITQKMLDELTICGTPEMCKMQIKKIRDAGVTNPIIQFNPVGNVSESFNLVAKTISDVD
jgi:5,10-methylenetetrahydromethanopterin reductase